jgi:isopentenyl-diphosphate delta-isomerase
MTGGNETAGTINRNLAIAAERMGVAMGVGSQRRALENPGEVDSFSVRQLAPSIPLIGNLGAVQLNYGYGLKQCESAVGMIEADALALHLNALQEVIQPEGQRNFSDLLPRIGEIVRGLSVPVIVKEIGCGLSARVGRSLLQQGVTILDTSGVGGTSWARIEARRADDHTLGELFSDWGIPTPESIQQLAALPDVTVIGSGGIRNGLDASKAIALGADLVGVAQPFLQAAMESPESVAAQIERFIREIKICMFCTGVSTIEELRHVPLVARFQR